MTLGVDIHPAARIGSGIMFDHATGIVIGETAVVEDDVSVLHSVTLGGTGKSSGDRHPKVRKGVLLSAGCKVIGNIEIGENAKVGHRCSVPAKIVGKVDVPANAAICVAVSIPSGSHQQKSFSALNDGVHGFHALRTGQ